MHDIYIRWPQLKATIGLSRTTIWRMEKAGQFPQRRSIGVNSVAWLQSEINAWIESRSIVGELQ